MKQNFTIACLLFFTAFAPALAQRPPHITPTRDVRVVYRFNGNTLPIVYNHRASTQQSRVELPLLGWGIYDHRTARLTRVSNLQRTVREETLNPAMRAKIRPQNMRFQREGQRNIAGHACTDWHVQANGNEDASVCLTEDGVLLNGALSMPDGRYYTVEAVSVSYTRQAASLFTVPADYRVTSRR